MIPSSAHSVVQYFFTYQWVYVHVRARTFELIAMDDFIFPLTKIKIKTNSHEKTNKQMKTQQQQSGTICKVIDLA